ncbi:low molecular weight phosphatase family protein [Microbacterium hominis]|uniref:Low molecular weight phosphatase family protein n=1 Tax=Microbacterium hominis TaxID=162426 RepID=A0A7D4QDI7_9MICO|nr:low molecular weight phosphatase family protein [Microbacterium hominis]QKJ20237.1 low molecular weight phosphatase family protein [Microbacterium hominis]
MFELLTVCTGNICRSPLAAQLLQTRLAPLHPTVTSAGTRGLDAVPMTVEAAHLAQHLGVSAELSAAHRSRFLTEADLVSPDLILTMTRKHRRAVAELAPSRMRQTFTVREFARITAAMGDRMLLAAASEGGDDPRARVRMVGVAAASQRGLAPAPSAPEEDDVIDPYRKPWEVYQQSAAQLLPAVVEVVRVLWLTASPAAPGR